MADAAGSTASSGLVDPTRGMVYLHRCMLPHVTLVAGRRARRQRRRGDGGGNKALFGDSGGAPLRDSGGALLASICLFSLTVRCSRCMVMRRHDRARGGCGYSGSGRGAIFDFSAAAGSGKGRWVRPIKNSYGLAGHRTRSG